MSSGTPPPDAAAACREGDAALARGAWEDARACFERALSAAESAVALEGLATAAFYLDDIPAVFAARERAFALRRENGESLAAARVAIVIAIDVMDFRPDSAVANGWLQRAARLLDGHERSPEFGMLTLLRGHQALMAGHDVAAARARAGEAMAIARETAAGDVQMMALALEGLAAVSEGEVAHGMGLLDEATATALSGEVRDHNLNATACCYLIHACERVRDFGRAAEWCERVREYCRRWRFASMFTICRTQYAAVLVAQGRWAEAEAELDAARAEFESLRPALAGSALVRLAALRVRQGRLAEAEALLERFPTHRLAPLVAADVATARGDDARAQAEAGRYLARIGSADLAERAAGLERLARAASRTGDREAASAAADELGALADRVGTDALLGAACLARALAMPAAHAAEARAALEEACERFGRAGMPWDAAIAEGELAAALARVGESAGAHRHAERAAAALEALGAVADAAAARAAAGESAAPTTAPEGPLSAREIEVLALIARGLPNARIAEQLFLSPHTVHRHVANILAKLDAASRAAAVAEATRRGLLPGA